MKWRWTKHAVHRAFTRNVDRVHVERIASLARKVGRHKQKVWIRDIAVVIDGAWILTVIRDKKGGSGEHGR